MTPRAAPVKPRPSPSPLGSETEFAEEQNVTPAKEAARKLTIGWIGAVRPSRQLLRSFLRVRGFLNAIKSFPHAEERSEARLEARTVVVQPIESEHQNCTGGFCSEEAR